MPPPPLEVAKPITPLYKTKFCDFFKRGSCAKGTWCPYAHGAEDLRPSPDFEKTALCQQFRSKGRCDNPKCRYAHDVEELRIAPSLLKTKMCDFYLMGRCDVGEACRFAHSADELQDAVGVSQASIVADHLPYQWPTAAVWGYALSKSPQPSAEQLEGEVIDQMVKHANDKDSDEDTHATFLTTENDESSAESEDADPKMEARTRLKFSAPMFVPIGFLPLGEQASADAWAW